VKVQLFTRRSRTFLGLLLSSAIFACAIGVSEKHMQLAEEFVRQGKFLSAIEEYSRVVNYGGRSVLAINAQKQIALVYEQYLKDFPRAIRAYRDAYQRSSDKRVKMEARWAIAKIYADRLENPVAAAEEFEALYKDEAKFEKEGAEILLSWAKALMDCSRFNEAANVLVEFRKNYPGHKAGPRALLQEGQARLADRRPEPAKDNFQEIINRFSGQEGYNSLVSEAYYGLGNTFEMKDQLDAALTAFRQSLAMYPNRAVVELKIQRVEKRKKERKL